MKLKTLLLGLFFFLLCPFSISSKSKIVILNMKPIGSIDSNLTNAITEILTTNIANTNTFSVIERSQINKIMEELNLASKDDFDDNLELFKQLARSFKRK